ncbi:hypothetical protein P20495_0766 [Pseudoalteromonas sp. BSi20495]|nr:hypothetical protein P20495_0766 [Pseudoalteromonas sp. BSi20495]
MQKEVSTVMFYASFYINARYSASSLAEYVMYSSKQSFFA